MLDYHLHLWPHSEQAVEPRLEEISKYCEVSTSLGVKEIALTEHLFRFKEAKTVLGKWWQAKPDTHLHSSMESYFNFHATESLEKYIEVTTLAKASGLPVITGLEVDYYPGMMDKVSGLLKDYPFDVLLGSVHWLDSWRFDDLDDAISMKEWDLHPLDTIWKKYSDAVVELSETKSCDVLAHPDLIKVTSRKITDTGLLNEFNTRIAESAKASNLSAEISSAGLRKPVREIYPSNNLLEKFVDLGVSLTTASDAHVVKDVSSHQTELKNLLDKYNIGALVRYRNREKYVLKLNEEDQ